MDTTRRNASLNRVRRQQSEFLNHLIDMQSMDAAANAAGISRRELHRWLQRPAFEKRLRRVISTMEKLKSFELRVASVKATQHVAEVAQGVAHETTPARRYSAACTIVREKRIADKEVARAKEKGQLVDEDDAPQCDCVNVLDMCHHSLTIEEKVRAYLMLHEAMEEGLEYEGKRRDPGSGPRDDELEEQHAREEVERLRREIPSTTMSDPRTFTAREPRHKRLAAHAMQQGKR